MSRTLPVVMLGLTAVRESRRARLGLACQRRATRNSKVAASKPRASNSISPALSNVCRVNKAGGCDISSYSASEKLAHLPRAPAARTGVGHAWRPRAHLERKRKKEAPRAIL